MMSCEDWAGTGLASFDLDVDLSLVGVTWVGWWEARTGIVIYLACSGEAWL